MVHGTIPRFFTRNYTRSKNGSLLSTRRRQKRRRPLVAACERAPGKWAFDPAAAAPRASQCIRAMRLVASSCEEAGERERERTEESSQVGKRFQWFRSCWERWWVNGSTYKPRPWRKPPATAAAIASPLPPRTVASWLWLIVVECQHNLTSRPDYAIVRNASHY